MSPGARDWRLVIISADAGGEAGVCWWLVITSADAGAEADVCDVDPGFPVPVPVTVTVTVTVTGSLRRMVEIWRGDWPWATSCAPAGSTSRGRGAAPGRAAVVHPVGVRAGDPAGVGAKVRPPHRWTTFIFL
jgi:hypothetical protein